jgi:hypothetical protein
MSDEPLAAPPTRGSGTRMHYAIGSLGFLGGVAVTAAAYQLAGGLPRPAAVPPPRAVSASQPVASAPALPPGTDIATLNAREQALAGRLDALELRLRDIDASARGASGYATRAEQLLVAAAVRRSIERGQPLGPVEQQLRRRFGDTHREATGAILRAAADPVTIGELRVALDGIAPRLMTAPDDSLWMRARRLFGDLIVVRQASSDSPRPADRLRRARRALDEGQVETALAEVAHMPGVQNAESWVSAARRYTAARQGLIEIERAALDAPPGDAPPIASPAPGGTG